MSSAREVRLRIKSIKSIAQVTRALQAVSASYVRKAMTAVIQTRPYTTRAWQVLTHLAKQPGRASVHPLLTKRDEIKTVLVILISGDRGLAGAYNSNVLRFAMHQFNQYKVPVRYITVGRKGRDNLLRRQKDIIAEFSHLPATPTFTDVAAIGKVAVEEFLKHEVDEVYLIYTDFINMVKQAPVLQKILPLEIEQPSGAVKNFSPDEHKLAATYIYEPDQEELLNEILPRFTALQVYHAILESLASEYAARMVAMKNATDSAIDLSSALQLEYNKARQQSITSEMLDIAGGAEAQVS
jgi:F-type H+-transporting ATPase subunit gamma